MIKGFQEISLIDYPGKIASVIFTSGCMFRCPFCHNASLAKNSSKIPEISQEKIIERLRARRSVIDGVVISGGEPTIHSYIPELVANITSLGLKVKLDTAGVNPDMLAELLPQLDYIAMDIKHAPEKYSQASGRPVFMARIQKSINLIKDSGVPYEFRTTVVPGMHAMQDFEQIGKLLEGAKKYCIQQFVPSKDMIDMSLATVQPTSTQFLEDIAKYMKKYIDSVSVRAYV